MTETKALYTEREGGRPDKRVFLGLNAQWRSRSGVVSRPIRPFIHSFISTGQAGCRAPEVACGKAGPLLVGRRPCTARPRRGDDAPLRKEGDSPGLRSFRERLHAGMEFRDSRVRTCRGPRLQRSTTGHCTWGTRGCSDGRRLPAALR